jgi:hypothetical protein
MLFLACSQTQSHFWRVDEHSHKDRGLTALKVILCYNFMSSVLISWSNLVAIPWFSNTQSHYYFIYNLHSSSFAWYQWQRDLSPTQLQPLTFAFRQLAQFDTARNVDDSFTSCDIRSYGYLCHSWWTLTIFFTPSKNAYFLARLQQVHAHVAADKAYPI